MHGLSSWMLSGVLPGWQTLAEDLLRQICLTAVFFNGSCPSPGLSPTQCDK